MVCVPARCSFNNPDLANRLVPVQPSEEEARQRAALLASTVQQRLASSSSSSNASVQQAAGQQVDGAAPSLTWQVGAVGARASHCDMSHACCLQV